MTEVLNMTQSAVSHQLSFLEICDLLNIDNRTEHFLLLV